MRFSFFILLLAISSCAFSCRVIDDKENLLHLLKPAKRIVSLSPDITEILFAIGAGPQVVGVISGSDYPEEALRLPRVGAYSGIDIERVLALKPDLIVSWSNTFSRQLLQLKRFNIPIYTTEPLKLEDIAKTMQHLGCLTDHQSMANQASNQFLKKIERLRQQNTFQKKLSIFFQIDPYALFTINKTSWINQVLERCGGQNIFAELSSAAPEVSFEAVVRANPQVIMSAAPNDRWKDHFEQWKALSAVQHQLLFTVNPDWIERAGPRLVNGAEQICAFMQKAQKIYNKIYSPQAVPAGTLAMGFLKGRGASSPLKLTTGFHTPWSI